MKTTINQLIGAGILVESAVPSLPGASRFIPAPRVILAYNPTSSQRLHPTDLVDFMYMARPGLPRVQLVTMHGLSFYPKVNEEYEFKIFREER